MDNYLKVLEITKDKGENNTPNREYYKCLYEYILSLIGFKNYEEALNLTYELDKGNEKDKNMSSYLRGKIFYKTKRYDEAIAIFEKLYQKDSIDRKSACIELSKIYTSLEKYDLANKYLDTLYKEYPNQSPELKMHMYYESKMHKECIDYSKKYLNTDFDLDAKYYMGRSLVKIGLYNEAKKLLEDIINLHPKNKVYYDLGIINERLGNFIDAYNNYEKYINYSYKSNIKEDINKGLVAMIEFLDNQYEFDEAYKYISLYESINQDNIDHINYIYAQYYYRKQDYENAEIYFKKLFATRFDNIAKNYLTVVYRYTNEKDKAFELFSELENTNFNNEVVLNKAKYLKDEHTKESLNESLYKVFSLKNTNISKMAISEELQILIKLGEYKKAKVVLEEAKEKYVLSNNEYNKYKSYLLYKTGDEELIEPINRTIFINYSINFNLKQSISSNLLLNESNKGKREIYLDIVDIESLINELSTTLHNYDYYTSDLYDIYIIDMGKIIGSFYGIETRYLEVKCEVNTTNIHAIQPTLKRINVTKYHNYQRIKTDLE